MIRWSSQKLSIYRKHWMIYSHNIWNCRRSYLKQWDMIRRIMINLSRNMRSINYSHRISLIRRRNINGEFVNWRRNYSSINNFSRMLSIELIRMMRYFNRDTGNWSIIISNSWMIRGGSWINRLMNSEIRIMSYLDSYRIVN